MIDAAERRIHDNFLLVECRGSRAQFQCNAAGSYFRQYRELGDIWLQEGRGRLPVDGHILKRRQLLGRWRPVEYAAIDRRTWVLGLYIQPDRSGGQRPGHVACRALQPG